MPDSLGLRSGLLVCLFLLASCASHGGQSSQPIECDYCSAWNEPQTPFQIYGNTYYVGTAGLSAVLIDSGDGLILLDGALPQSAAQIASNIVALGFDPLDIRLIGLSHAHFDHAGGVAELQRRSSARVITGAGTLETVRTGVLQPDDPQWSVDALRFPAVPSAEAARAEYPLGDVTLVAIDTPGHTTGGLSWTWNSCEANACLTVVYADSLTPVSAAGYRYSNTLADDLRRSAADIAALECDILLSPHPGFFAMTRKLEQGRSSFIDDTACQQYAAKAVQRLQNRLQQEQQPSSD